MHPTIAAEPDMLNTRLWQQQLATWQHVHTALSKTFDMRYIALCTRKGNDYTQDNVVRIPGQRTP